MSFSTQDDDVSLKYKLLEITNAKYRFSVIVVRLSFVHGFVFCICPRILESPQQNLPEENLMTCSINQQDWLWSHLYN